MFAQAANVDRLLTMLRQMENASDKESLADDEEIQVSLVVFNARCVFTDCLQELYRTSMALRPKIVKLIDKYSQKRGKPSTLDHSICSNYSHSSRSCVYE